MCYFQCQKETERNMPMFKNYTVEKPVEKGKIITTKRESGEYVYFKYGRKYFPDRKYEIPLRVCIGRVDANDSTKMFPNENYDKYFEKGAAEIEPVFINPRSSCLSVGTYILAKAVVEKNGILDWMKDNFGKKDGGLIVDLANYSLISEKNSAQHYPDYAYVHTLFTQDMRIYSDSKIGILLQRTITRDSVLDFLNFWNESKDHRRKIYFSYDSTNKICQVGDVDLSEIGHSKTGSNSEHIVNLAIATDVKTKTPLFYEEYPGSLVDVSQLPYLVETAKDYGYKNIGFILDRGYFSRSNIKVMDDNGYSFIIMCKGQKELVSSLILNVKGSFEDSIDNSIYQYHSFGTTVESKLYEGDNKVRYFHIFYSPEKANSEKQEIDKKLSMYTDELKKLMGKEVLDENLKVLSKYFDLSFDKQGKKKVLVSFEPKKEVFNHMLKLAGYYCIITSDKMEAKEALLLYKSRDFSEKLFAADKSFLGSKSERVYSTESVKSKIFIEFIALIIRSSFYASIFDYVNATRVYKKNYYNVVSLISEMEKIQIIKNSSSGSYHLDNALTARQKELLGIFGMDEEMFKEECKKICTSLSVIDTKDAKNRPTDKDLRDDTTTTEEEIVCLD